MIIINLLPEHLRPVKHSILPYLAAVIFFALALAGMGMLFMTGQGRIAMASRELAQKEQELAGLSDTVEKYNALTQQKLDFEEKVQVIKDILSTRIVWSEQLYNLTKVTPDNIWYKRIRVVWQNFREMQVKVDPKTGEALLDPRTQQPQTETKTIPRPVLEISGYVVTDEQGSSRISPLTERTTQKTDKWSTAFAEQFEFVRPTMEVTEFGGFEVRGFTLEYLIRRKGGSG